MTAKRILAGLLAMLMLVPMFCACNPDTPDTPDTPDSSDTSVNTPEVSDEKIRYIFADGSEEKPYDPLGMETDPDQMYDVKVATLGLWKKPKENRLVITDIPENFETYVYMDMDVYLNSGLPSGLRMYIYCGVDESGEESYFYRDFSTTKEGWVTLSYPMVGLTSQGNADLAKAERIELIVNDTGMALRQLYVRSISARNYYDGDEPMVYEDAEDVFDYILQQYEYLEFGGYRKGDSLHESIINGINSSCKTWWDRVSGDETANNPFGFNSTRYPITGANMTSLYANMEAMARAYATYGSAYYKNEELRDDLIYCLDIMYEHFFGGDSGKMPEGTNWYDSYVTAPLSLSVILLALRHDLTIEQLDHYMDWMDILATHSPYTGSGGPNLINMSKWVIMSAAMQKQGERLEKAVDKLAKDVFHYVKIGDGMYEDGSYIYHGSVPYTTGYGGDLLQGMSYVMYVVAGTEYSFSQEHIDMQVSWVFEAFEPVMWRGAAMSAVSGRIIWSNPTESARANCVIVGMAHVAEYAPAEKAAQMKSLLKYYLVNNPTRYENNGSLSTGDLIAKIRNDDSIVPAEPRVGAKVFGNMARITTHRGDFASMLAMSNPRVSLYEGFVWSESNMENCTGWYTGAGMLYVYADRLDQYDKEYHHNVNRYRLPGTTIDTRPRVPENNMGVYNKSAFVGGAQLDVYVAAAYDYDNNNGDFESDLVAKKSYFFFDNEYVMLGAGINSTLDEGVVTTVENQKSNGMYLNDDKEAIAYTEDTLVEGVKYAHIKGYGSIVFPEKQDLTVKLARRENTYFTEIMFNHGVNPTNDTYSYIILPLASQEDGKAYYENPDVEILANTDTIQAVRDNKLGLTGIVFWEAAEFQGITPAFACTMLVKDTENGKQIAVSDPTMSLRGKHIIVVDGVYTLDGTNDKVTVTDDGSKTTVSVDLTGMIGQSVLFDLTKK